MKLRKALSCLGNMNRNTTELWGTNCEMFECSRHRKRTKFCLTLLSKNSMLELTGFRHLVALVFNFWGISNLFPPYATQLSFYLEIIFFIGRSFYLNWKEKHLWSVKLEAMLLGWNAVESSRISWFRKREFSMSVSVYTDGTATCHA